MNSEFGNNEVAKSSSRRPYGTGSIFRKGQSWYGQWSVKGTLVKRSLGPARTSQNRHGLTRRQAEERLREEIALVKATPVFGKLTFSEAGRRHLAKLKLLGRKSSTLEDYRGYLRQHLNPAFGDQDVSTIKKKDIERFIAQKLRAGLSPKSVRNYLGLLHGVLEFCVKEELIVVNPAKLVDKPRTQAKDPGLKFLNLSELDALIAAIPDDHLGSMERALYRTCAMTGLRQGEACALRWQDVDWINQKVRVNRSYVRGEFVTPKSRLGTRAVPMAMQVAGDLARLQKQSRFDGDEDLVFCNPSTGRPYDRSKLLKRFKAAIKKAQVTEIPFHGLRHTFGTRMAMAGVPMRQLQEWGGWKDFQTVLIYAHFAPGDQDAELVAKAFGATTDPLEQQLREGIDEGIDSGQRA